MALNGVNLTRTCICNFKNKEIHTENELVHFKKELLNQCMDDVFTDKETVSSSFDKYRTQHLRERERERVLKCG